jgi:hypothetical protein
MYTKSHEWLHIRDEALHGLGGGGVVFQVHDALSPRFGWHVGTTAGVSGIKSLDPAVNAEWHLLF